MCLINICLFLLTFRIALECIFIDSFMYINAMIMTVSILICRIYYRKMGWWWLGCRRKSGCRREIIRGICRERSMESTRIVVQKPLEGMSLSIDQ